MIQSQDALPGEPPMTNHTPDAMVLVPLYYMRDNHTFRRLSDNPTAALAEVMEEFDAGWSHGMLCTKRPGDAGALHVHASGPGRKFEFEADAAAWLERQRILAAPPAEPAEPSVPADGVTDAGRAFAAAAWPNAPIEEWPDRYCADTVRDIHNGLRAALAPLHQQLADVRAEANNKEFWMQECGKERDRREAAERDARELRGRLTEILAVDEGGRDAFGHIQQIANTALATPSGAPDSGEAT